MLFTTTTQFAALALCLVAGWFLGLASSSGGRKWKTRYATEREAHAGCRKQSDTALADANRHLAELERENARLASAASAAPAAPQAGRAAGQPVASRVRPAYPADHRPGWFDFGAQSRA